MKQKSKSSFDPEGFSHDFALHYWKNYTEKENYYESGSY